MGTPIRSMAMLVLLLVPASAGAGWQEVCDQIVEPRWTGSSYLPMARTECRTVWVDKESAPSGISAETIQGLTAFLKLCKEMGYAQEQCNQALITWLSSQ